MRINLKSFRKIKEDVETATLKNERGHQITLSKKSLRPHLLKTLTSLPLHLAEGTPEGVESPNSKNVPQDNLEGQGVPTLPPGPQFLDQNQQAALAGYMQPPEALPVATEIGQALGSAIGKFGVQPVMMVARAYGDAIGQGIEGAQNMASGVGAGLRQGMGLPPSAPQLPSPPMEGMAPGGPQLASAPDSAGLAPNMQAAPTPGAAAEVPSGVPSAGGQFGQYQRGIQQQVGGINQEVKAIQESSQKQQALYAERAEAAKQLHMQYQQQLGDLNVERENIINDIRANKINSNQYVENMSSKQRTFTMIGLMLSGAGAGLSHQNSLAADFLQKQIDRDINAQVKNMDSRNNLLSANMQQYGNLRDAINMTRINMQDILANQIAEEAARSSYPLAKAKAQQAIGALMADSALKAKELVAMTMAPAPASDPNQIPAYLDALERVNPKRAQELRDRFVPGVGFAQSNEGAKSLREMQGTSISIKKDLQRLREILNTTGKSLSPTLRAEADTLRNSLVGALRVPITGPGSMSEGDRELLLRMIPAVADFTSMDARSRKRLETIEAKVDGAYEGMLRANGLQGNNIATDPNEGKVARNKQGQRIIMKNGKWAPL